MRPLAALLCVTSLLSMVRPAFAQPELARSKICLGCHAVDKKQIGPAFKDVAVRYAGQKDAAARLADKIVIGGSGAWGAVPMPANPKVSAEEARQLADWVLTLH